MMIHTLYLFFRTKLRESECMIMSVYILLVELGMKRPHTNRNIKYENTIGIKHQRNIKNRKSLYD